MSSDPIGRVVSVTQVAAWLGWSPKTVRARLRAIEAENPGSAVMRNLGKGKRRPSYAVSLRALQVLFPEWFGVGSDLAEMNVKIEELEGEVRELKEQVKRLEFRQDMTKKRIDSQFPKAG